MFVLNSLLGTIAEFFVILIVTILLYFKWEFTYWKRRKVPYFRPAFPFGNTENPLKATEHRGVQITRYYRKIRQNGWKGAGYYAMTSHQYIPADLEHLKHILAKDFSYFTDRGMFYNEEVDHLSGHLFFLGGLKWKNLRVKLTPTFTSGKMKGMFQNLVDCVPGLLQKMEGESVKAQGFDIKELLSCFATNIIGTTAFGLELKTFQDDNSPFRSCVKKVFTSTSKLWHLRGVLLDHYPELGRKLKVRRNLEVVRNFFTKVVKDTVQHREENNITRKDFLQLLVDLKNNPDKNGESITLPEIVAQCFVFFLAGSETSATTGTFALYEMSRNQDIQDKVRKEVNEVIARYDGQITYDGLKEMKYMQQVVDESLRKYPPVPTITRRCIKDYKLPDQDIVIEKGTKIQIPILGIQHDPEYFSDPERFDPERFTEDKKLERNPYCYLPFGEGPRICIGLRFGMMQVKVGLAALLQNYKFTVAPKTREPLEMQANCFVLAARGEIWLKAEKI